MEYHRYAVPPRVELVRLVILLVNVWYIHRIAGGDTGQKGHSLTSPIPTIEIITVRLMTQSYRQLVSKDVRIVEPYFFY